MRGEAMVRSLSRDTMKNRTLERLGLGLTLALLPLAGGCLQQTAASPEPVASATRPSDELQYAALQPDQKAISAEPTVETGISDAPAKPISTEKPLPPEIHPTPALSETI